MADIAMPGFAVLFLQFPSFLHARWQLQTRHGRVGARTLSGIGTICLLPNTGKWWPQVGDDDPLPDCTLG